VSAPHGRSGLWKDLGRPPQKLTGVGFISEGFDPARIAANSLSKVASIAPRSGRTARPTLPQFSSRLMPDANSSKNTLPNNCLRFVTLVVTAERLATPLQLFYI
jgi:hypothetical protein